MLDRIADAINSAVDDVNVTVVSSTEDNKCLTIVSDEAGSENALSLADDSGLELLFWLDFITASNSSRQSSSKTQGWFIETDTNDLDALFEVNGIEITSSKQ